MLKPLLLALTLTTIAAAQTKPFPPPPANPALPTIYIAGDSTAAPHQDTLNEGALAQQGWGVYFAQYFDPAKVNVINAARGGRSSRTYITEGLWDQLTAQLKPGDVVLIQFGQNDVFPLNDDSRARGTIPGIGPETQEIDNLLTKKHEVVHTFGWYTAKMIQDVKARGATPIVLSVTPRDIWKNGVMERGAPNYREWAHTVALHEGRTDFVDVSNIFAREYEKLGQQKTAALYHAKEPVHVNTIGAALNAQWTVSGLKGLLSHPVSRFLSPAGLALPSSDELAFRPAANPALPTLFIIGDSTVRNGDGEGLNGQWGWGDELAPHFNLAKINIVNRAVSGTSSRTYYANHWPFTLALLKPGDFVFLQFGHNDNGDPADKSRARAALPGIGDETKTILNPHTGLEEKVHTYGWYLRQFIHDAKRKGATPVIVSPIPRKTWNPDNTIRRDPKADDAGAIAEDEHVPFLDLNSMVAARYNHLGKEKVETLFADPNTHTTLEGAQLNADTVAIGIRQLRIKALTDALNTKPAQAEAAPVK